MVKLFDVKFKDGIQSYTIAARTMQSAVIVATKLFKKSIDEDPSTSDDGKTVYDWNYYLRNGLTQIVRVELIAESDN